jgi:hypothetical protein
MNFDDSAAGRDRFNPETEYPLLLKAFEYTIKNTVLAPTVHACIYAMPTAEILRQAASFALMFRNVQNRIQYPGCRNEHSLFGAESSRQSCRIVPE